LIATWDDMSPFCDIALLYFSALGTVRIAPAFTLLLTKREFSF
jgi:hypothetical protein